MPRRNTHFLRSFILMTSLSLSIAARTKQKQLSRDKSIIFTPQTIMHIACIIADLIVRPSFPIMRIPFQLMYAKRSLFPATNHHIMCSQRHSFPCNTSHIYEHSLLRHNPSCVVIYLPFGIKMRRMNDSSILWLPRDRETQM